MLQVNGTGGLCMTCNNSPTCYYHATRGPALFCDLFDNYVAPVKTTIVDEARPVQAKAPVVEEQLTVAAGLCMNCEHRMDCVHAKTTGGVWHCEEYE